MRLNKFAQGHDACKRARNRTMEAQLLTTMLCYNLSTAQAKAVSFTYRCRASMRALKEENNQRIFCDTTFWNSWRREKAPHFWGNTMESGPGDWSNHAASYDRGSKSGRQCTPPGLRWVKRWVGEEVAWCTCVCAGERLGGAATVEVIM